MHLINGDQAEVRTNNPAKSSLHNVQIVNALVVVASIASISFLHFQTVDAHPLLHELTQRMYYLPIIYAAWRFGWRGGIGAAVLSVLLFLPHLRLHLHEPEIYQNQTAEMILFVVIGVVTGLLTDLQKRERLRYEQTVKQLMLSDRLASLGRLSAGLVHEIRNPLASIKGAAEVLESEISAENKKRIFLDAISGEVNRLDNLIKDFLIFARPRSPELLPTDPNMIIRSVVSLTLNELERRQLTLTTNLAEGIPKIRLDGEQVKQALLNLVINAIQATPPGGEIMLSSSFWNGIVRLTVQDSGPGIPQSIKDQLFTPFVTTKEGGTGLGLPIALSLVKQHGGNITAEDSLKGGSSFQIEFPLVTSASYQSVVKRIKSGIAATLRNDA
jgi:signal transduction histidine kinase